MKNQSSILFSMLFCLLFWSCGGGSSEAADEAADETEMEEPSSSSNNSDSEPANLTEAMQQMQDAVKKMGNGESVELVDFRTLRDQLPEKLLGMERKSRSGQKSGFAGFNVSTAEAKYQDGDKRLEITLVDSGNIGLAAMGMSWSMVEIDKEDDNGYERTVDIDGFRGFEKYNAKNKSGELAIFYNNRILVTIQGDNIEADDLREVWDDLNMDDLDI